MQNFTLRESSASASAEVPKVHQPTNKRGFTTKCKYTLTILFRLLNFFDVKTSWAF